MLEPDLRKHLKLTAELYGKTLSEAGATMLAADLSRFTPAQVIASLAKCRQELRTFPTVADISARVDDGRPGVEEAWAMVPKDEVGSVVWNDEIAEAFGVARAILVDGDLVAARMAFKEVYTRLLAEARARGRPPKWWPSLGQDKSGRERAVAEAVERGRIAQADAVGLIGYAPSSRAVMPTGELVRVPDMVATVTKKGDW